MQTSLLLPVARYSLVICRNRANKFLCVQERNGKWWIPAGGVNPHETYHSAAIRETLEETGIEVALRGIISFDHLDFKGKDRVTTALRLVYYAEPIDEHAVPKQTPDQESLGAAFLTLPEILKLKPHWRVPEIYNYPKYL